MGYMTPAEFEDRMRALFRDYGNDDETFHAKAEELIVQVLVGLGYTSGIDVYNYQKTWNR